MEILGRSATNRFSQVRLVGKGINQIVSIQDALSQAEETELDLVLVSEDARPPVVRIQDFKKIEYEKKKAKKAARQNTSTLKEIQFKVNISEHDFETKLNKIRKFLDKGDKVKICVRLKGRERETPERAQDILRRIIDSGIEAKVSTLPGPIAMMILEPGKRLFAKN